MIVLSWLSDSDLPPVSFLLPKVSQSADRGFVITRERPYGMTTRAGVLAVVMSYAGLQPVVFGNEKESKK